MDIGQAANFFNKDRFDAYDFVSKLWDIGAVEGKLKYAPESFSVNDLATRKRMLFTVPGMSPNSSVIRAQNLDQIFLVEGEKGDLFNNEHYRSMYNLHQAMGAAEVWRRAPVGPANDPGWALSTKIEDTFADVGFDRVPTDQERVVHQYGLHTVYLPSDSQVARQDTVVLLGKIYFLFDVYQEQGLMVARATVRPDPRRNIIYRVITPGVYDPVTMTPGSTSTNYNVTAQIDPIDMSELSEMNILKDSIKVLIDVLWIGVTPKINDEIVALGKTYKVEKITQNTILDQWEIIACV